MRRAERPWSKLLSIAVLVWSSVPLQAEVAAVLTGGTNPLVPIALVAIVLVVAGYIVSALLKGIRSLFRRSPKKISSPTQNPKPAPPAPPEFFTQPVPFKPGAVKSIFISYRRIDSQHITGRIYDRLLGQFGMNAVFKDVDSIPIGIKFREHLEVQVGRCSVLVAVIGKKWNQASPAERPRLDDPADYLRIEIETALRRGIPVIPVLVDGVQMPAKGELPPSMQYLVDYNGIPIRPDPDFHHDADRLVHGIESLLK